MRGAVLCLAFALAAIPAWLVRAQGPRTSRHAGRTGELRQSRRSLVPCRASSSRHRRSGSRLVLARADGDYNDYSFGAA
jgi:hypothetical protein